ncbi:hypothetical protein CAPTEDRAFT_181075 [Capitella teleta]|uniref:Secernin-2 n=1 Tax=Capitella teleta TaxID=283909 RepID=R7U0I6_CAPTE|nr:hypothetical protein CAPTEDRAFT_181075 [Capitella teleta]|eukprot:ELT99347.1 hypothetical protein CAPTEDRAFT_181075 [Capitella teleta]
MDSCDTFVALPPVTAKGKVIFGKNSDRPASEVQEVIFQAAADHADGSTCSYLSIPQVPHTHAVILSKPAWMWGAEMGANEKGVAIGNEAVWTKVLDGDEKEERLTGMDLVRLGLERGSNAREALDAIASALSSHGQGGPCFEDPERTGVVYHNSFIIADSSEAWVMETAGKHWAAEKVEAGVRNISNQLSIGTKIDAMSEGLKEFAEEKGWWKSVEGEFNFAEAFSAPPQGSFDESESPSRRYSSGAEHMTKLAQNNEFKVTSMFQVLRDEAGGICRTGRSGSVTTASQVSVLSHVTPACHWLTATPNPARSVFKPFVFVPDCDIGEVTKSPDFGADDPAKTKPRFQKEVNREHELYVSHRKIRPLPGDLSDPKMLSTLACLEMQCVYDVEDLLDNYNSAHDDELKDLFKDIVESEVKFYK